MKEKKIKNKKGDVKHGLIRWVERKQQRKLAGFFIAIPYLKGQILNYQNTKDLKESLMVVDQMSTLFAKHHNWVMTKQKKKQKRWCQHGLVRWVEQKQQNKLVRFFIAIPYLKGLILNYQNIEDMKESLMVVDQDVHIICQTP